MHDYIHRNGISEQTRWLRQQPYHMRYVPFDFEIKEHARSHVRGELIALAFTLALVLLVALW